MDKRFSHCRKASIIVILCAAGIPCRLLPQAPRFLKDIDVQAKTSNETGNYDRYSTFLISQLVPETLPAPFRAVLAQRLAMAEATQERDHKAGVPEAAVARAFNDFIVDLAPTSSIRTDVGVIEYYRQILADNAPNATSVRNSRTSCTPAEAVLLMSLLIINDGSNGRLSDENGQRPTQHQMRAGVIVRRGPTVNDFMRLYFAKQPESADISLFTKLANTLNF